MKQLLTILILIFIISTGVNCKDRTGNSSVRQMLADCLLLCLAQRLIPARKGARRVLALEKLINSPTALSIARIESYYTDNGFFLDGDNYVLDNAHKIAHIPCRIVQGRYDIICPMISAWDLHKALPNSVLRIVADGSHSPMSPGMIEELVQASEDFKSLATPATR